MIRILRARTFRELAAKAAETNEAETAAKTYSAEAERWHQAYSDEVLIANEAEKRLQEAEEQLADKTALVDLVTELRDRAAAPATGSEFRGRLALAVLQKTLADLDPEAREAPSVLVLSAVLGLADDADQDAEEGAPRP